MTQRPRIGQLKQNDINFATFKEQFEMLEGNAKHIRKPVRTKGELPFDGNIDGSECLVVEEGVTYYWDSHIQNWQPILGQMFRMDNINYQRWRKTYKASKGQTDFMTNVQFNVGRNEVDVYVQGMLQDVNIDYIELDNQTIRFVDPLPEKAVITIATPMIVESLTNINTVLKRLEDLEYNHYQLMLSQYYDGKDFEALGMVYDGFINTEQIDYTLTSINIVYDIVRKSMIMRHATDSGIIEQFDDTLNILPSSTVQIANSEMTLPIAPSYIAAFSDDFSTKDFIDNATSTVYWDKEKQHVTNDDTYGGSTHYYKGDFMNGTGNVDSVAFPDAINKVLYYSYGNKTEDISIGVNCYGVLAMGDRTCAITEKGILYRNVWPYNSQASLYSHGDKNKYRTMADYVNSGVTEIGKNIFVTNNTYPRQTMTYIRKHNRLLFLYQYKDASGKYYQRLHYGNGRSQDIGAWTLAPRPTGLPKTLFGSEVNDFTQSDQFISQIGATYEHLLIRAGNKLYFLDEYFTVVKVLDWSTATRKPSTYSVLSQQITADKRYLYFPARLLRGGVWGYYLEVFAIEDGSYVNEILVTTHNSGNPGTTAMGFDHDVNRLVLGQCGSTRYDLFGKDRNAIQESTAYAGMLIFEAQNERERELITKPFTTNLPSVSYQLNASQTLNGGTIDHYIRFGNEAWTKINLDTDYAWVNPNGAKDVTVQLRAVLKSALTSSMPPILTAWRLLIKPFEKEARYYSVKKTLQLDSVIGGGLNPSQIVPNETQINWYIETDYGDRIFAGRGGEFHIPSLTGKAYFSVEATLSTNNVLLSPVVHDYQLQLYQQSEGVLYTEATQQLHDIEEVNLWATTNSNENAYVIDVSRDDGITWSEMKKQDVVQLSNGHLETKWFYRFNGNESIKRRFKLRFRLNGSFEIFQYGAKLN